MRCFQRFTAMMVGALFVSATCGAPLFGKSPGQVVTAAYTAANAGQYSEASKYLSSDALRAAKGDLGALAGGMKGIWDTNTRNGSIAKIEILHEEVRGEGAEVSYRFTFKDNTKREDCDPLIKENGDWKIASGRCAPPAQRPSTRPQASTTTDSARGSRSSRSAAAFSFLGSFSNQAHFDLKHPRPTYRVLLWRDSVAGVVGHVYYPTEVEIDTPRGCVERAKYEASTGALTFQARLWAGESEPGVAVHEIHEFAGRLTGSSLEGIFKRYDEKRPGGQTERVELKKEHVDAQFMKFASLAAWREQNPKIGFEYCGPK